MSVVKSPVCWMGGKARWAEKIVRVFSEHVLYVEPFGGGGHVLCRKAPSQGEVYNDLDSDLVNFFKVARDDCEALVAKLRLTPYSRKQYQMFRSEWRGNRWRELPDLDRAAIWYSILKQTFAASLVGASWGYTTWRGGRSGSWQPDTFANSVENLFGAFRDRLRHVQIENLGFEDCITRYQSEHALIYCDPPYVGTEGLYKEGTFNEADHRRLAELLHATPARVVVSYQAHELVGELYEGWRQETFQAVRSSQRTKAGVKKKVETELVLMNW